MSIIDTILHCDVLDGLKQIPDNYVHLIVTSPPYNVGIPYDGYTDDRNHVDYLNWLKSVWDECRRVLVKGGRLCVNIDITNNDEENTTERLRPLHVDVTNQLRELNYIYRTEILWCKQNYNGRKTAFGSYCLPSNPHLRRNNEYIVIGSKDDLKLEGDYMMADITPDEFKKWTFSVWDFNPETGNQGHPVPFPRELPKRCIKLFSYVGNIVLDPFCGSGTTCTTALSLGRHYLGIEQSRKYCDITKNKLDIIKQELQIAGGYKFTPSPVLVRKQMDVNKQNVNKNDMFSEYNNQC